MTDKPTGEIIFYQTPDGGAGLEVKLEQDTVWLTQKQMAELFATERSVITKHLSNIFKSGELAMESNVQKMHITGSDRPVSFFKLDAIISVGYRVNSKRGTQFRIWATQILKDHILKGYSLNEKRLKENQARLLELQQTVSMMGRILGGRELNKDEASGLLHVILDYTHALTLLDKYDHQQLEVTNTTSPDQFTMTYERACDAISKLGEQSGMATGLFGQEKDNSFKSTMGALYQTFGGKPLYPSIEEKAAHLLYFVIKNHSFLDGNKRIGAFLFLWFLDANGILYDKSGRKRIGDNALVALSLMIAESNPKDKETIAKVIINLINRDN